MPRYGAGPARTPLPPIFPYDAAPAPAPALSDGRSVGTPRPEDDADESERGGKKPARGSSVAAQEDEVVRPCESEFVPRLSEPRRAGAPSRPSDIVEVSEGRGREQG
jgi:hypothetical protein